VWVEWVDRRVIMRDSAILISDGIELGMSDGPGKERQ